MRICTTVLILGATVVFAGCAGPAPTKIDSLGIAELQIHDTPALKSIVGLDANAVEVARYDVALGRYTMSAYFADGAATEVDGRQITIHVGSANARYEGVDYPDMNEVVPLGPIATFVRDPNVAPVLASWGIRYHLPGAPVRPSEMAEVAYDDCTDCVGNPGFTGSGDCPDVECGYLFGEAGSPQVYTGDVPRVTTTDGGCTGGGCAVCAASGPSTHVAVITSAGELNRESYIAQMCENPTALGGFPGPFFEVKACRPVTNPVQCPSGGNYTGCGCTTARNVACKPCTNYGSEGDHQTYQPPFGEIDDGFDASSNHLEWSYHDQCYPKDNVCTDDSQCCNSCCDFSEGSLGRCKPGRHLGQVKHDRCVIDQDN